MIVERLDVENVRNIESTRLELDPGVNLLIGPNGAGKTALLEAVYLLIRGRSFRTSRTDTVIRGDQQQMAIGMGCRDAEQGALRLSYRRERRGRVEWRRDGRVVRQSSAIARLLPIQLLLPELADLVFGAPAGRRQWLDWGAFHVKHDHAANLRSYLRALRHRNAVLREGDLKTLPAWTAQVVEFGHAVAAARQAYFERAAPHIQACLAALSPDLSVDVGHFPGWHGDDLAETLGQERDSDVKSGATRSGPHRADLRLECGSGMASLVLSRGQGKVVASAFRLGQAKDLASAGKRTLFLIDDIGAELDREHNERFYALLDDMACQIVAASAHPDMSDALVGARLKRVFHVKQGRAAPAGEQR